MPFMDKIIHVPNQVKHKVRTSLSRFLDPYLEFGIREGFHVSNNVLNSNIDSERFTRH